MTKLENQKKTFIHDDEINIIELLSILWASRLKIFLITIFFGIFSIYYALSIPNQYTAFVTLSPLQSSNDASLSGAISQFGGLASLAGININSNMADETEIAIEIMQSWSFIEQFIKTHNISVELTAVRKWDKQTDSLLIDEGVFNAEDMKWLEVPPSSWKLFQSFSNLLKVSKNRDTGLVNVSIEYYSPKLAKKWLDLLIRDINDHMQKRKLDDVNRNINYLETEVKKTVNAEMKQVFYTLIEEQIKSKMLAYANPEYVFRSLGPSMMPEVKSKPNRAIICILITFFGAFSSVLFFLARFYLKS